MWHKNLSHIFKYFKQKRLMCWKKTWWIDERVKSCVSILCLYTKHRNKKNEVFVMVLINVDSIKGKSFPTGFHKSVKFLQKRFNFANQEKESLFVRIEFWKWETNSWNSLKFLPVTFSPFTVSYSLVWIVQSLSLLIVAFPIWEMLA